MPKFPASIRITLPAPRTSATVLQPSPPWHTVLPGKPCTRMSIEKPPTVIGGWVAGAFMETSSTSRFLVRDREKQIFPRTRLLLHRAGEVHELDELHHVDRRGGVVDIRIADHLLHLIERGALLLGHRHVDLCRLARICLDEGIRLIERGDYCGADLRICIVEFL